MKLFELQVQEALPMASLDLVSFQAVKLGTRPTFCWTFRWKVLSCILLLHSSWYPFWPVG